MIRVAIAALLVMTSQAAAAPDCIPREVALQRLAETYGEARRGVGLTDTNVLMELFVSDATGTWTIVLTTANGISCLGASGQGYQALIEELPPAGTEG